MGIDDCSEKETIQPLYMQLDASLASSRNSLHCGFLKHWLASIYSQKCQEQPPQGSLVGMSTFFIVCHLEEQMFFAFFSDYLLYTLGEGFLQAIRIIWDVC